MADWQRLAGAWGSLRRALALKEAFGAPAGRRRSHLGFDTGELLPAAVRANGAATAFGVHWLCNIVIGNYFLVASQRFGVPACYSLFGAVALAGAAFCASQVPETKGRSLEEIEAKYAPA